MYRAEPNESLATIVPRRAPGVRHRGSQNPLRDPLKRCARLLFQVILPEKEQSAAVVDESNAGLALHFEANEYDVGRSHIYGKLVETLRGTLGTLLGAETSNYPSQDHDLAISEFDRGFVRAPEDCSE